MRIPSMLSLLLLGACSTGLTVLGDTSVLPEDPSVEADTDVDTDIDTDVDADTDADADPANNPPTADAGVDQFNLTGSVVQLDGIASSDPDGDVLNYFWQANSSPAGWAGSVINETRFDAQFFADTEGTYVLELTVDDGEFSASDTVTITIETPNEVPVANAGSDQYVEEGDLVQLNGSNSYDPDSDPLSYSWTAVDSPVGSSAALSDAGSPLPSFTADLEGTYLIELVVEDVNGNLSAPDQVRITATASGGNNGGGGCGLGCIAQTQHRLTTGSSAAMPGFLLLPVFFVLYRRRTR